MTSHRIKIALRVVTVAALAGFVVLQIIVRLPPRVRLRPESERAKIPIAADSYPCVLVERAKETAKLQAAIRQCSPHLNNDVDIEQYEVDLRSGLFILRKTDLFVPDSMPLALTRCYRLWDNRSFAFGLGSNHAYDIFPNGDHFPYTYMNLNLADGVAVRYDRISQGTSYQDFVAEHKGASPTAFQGSVVRWRKDHWELTLQDGTVIVLPDSYLGTTAAWGAPWSIRSPQGEEIKLARDEKRNLTAVTSPHGHYIRFAYDSSGRIVEASDNAGRAIDYYYEDRGRLAEVKESGRLLWRYVYHFDGISSVQDADQHDLVAVQYSGGRISSLTADGVGTYRFAYLESRGGKVDETEVTDPGGKASTFVF
jgi:YD repeat-containing protein